MLQCAGKQFYNKDICLIYTDTEINIYMQSLRESENVYIIVNSNPFLL